MPLKARDVAWELACTLREHGLPVREFDPTTSIRRPKKRPTLKGVLNALKLKAVLHAKALLDTHEYRSVEVDAHAHPYLQPKTIEMMVSDSLAHVLNGLRKDYGGEEVNNVRVEHDTGTGGEVVIRFSRAKKS